MLVFMANNDANNANGWLHGLSSLVFTIPAMENGEKSKSEYHIGNPIVDTFMIFTHQGMC